MKIKPKYSNLVKVELNISDNASLLLKHYADYTKYSESEIVDMMLIEEILKDDDFLSFVKGKRFNKKIQERIEYIVESIKYPPEAEFYEMDDEHKAYIDSLYEDY